MAQEKISMPSSGGGIVRYFDDYKSKLQVGPMVVIYMIIAVILIEILLHTIG
jgi:preprotein translocase subunit Sec61beta